MKKSEASLPGSVQYSAAAEILSCYSTLAEQGKHLLSSILTGSPVQWMHYPENDVIDRKTGYQYFYHSHSPEDREDCDEHGHFHLFARVDEGQHAVELTAANEFCNQMRSCQTAANTINLLCISLDAKGVPTMLFTVNRWVTGDHVASASATLKLLAEFDVSDDEHGLVNRWLKAMIQLFWPQIVELQHERDNKLLLTIQETAARNVLDDEELEVLSSRPININDQVLHALQSRSDITKQEN